MKVTLSNEVVRKIGLQTMKQWGADKENNFHWHGDLSIHLNSLTLEKCDELDKLLSQYTEFRGVKSILRDIATWKDIKNKKLKKIVKVDTFAHALIEYLRDIDGHRIFERDSLNTDSMLCFRVSQIEYHAKEHHNYSTTPEHVTMDVIYKKFGIDNQSTFTFWGDDIRHKTVPEALSLKGLQAETKELRKEYLEDVDRYRKVSEQIGKQFIANGIGLDDTLDDKDDDYRSSRSHSRRGKEFKFENNRVVIDVFMESESEYHNKENKIEDGAWWWTRIGKDDDEYDENEYPDMNDEDVEIPIHPKIVVFDLTRHLRLVTHVDYVKEYEYDVDLASKLVLNQEVRDLIETLVKYKEGGFKDIIKGKSGGTIILLSGKAGVGKTLTAEVFAEYQKKPLYSVQASQLGINPEELERELKRVLERSARWDAILLIDEADVYVHERGSDLVQNAIVGVFLRILEYHASTLFLTTNRPDVIDDAIASRCIARVDYKYPTKEQQIEIWNIISQTSGIKINPEVINKFVELNSKYSGRDIKNLIKLSNLKSIADKKEIDVEMIKFVARFNPTLLDMDVK